MLKYRESQPDPERGSSASILIVLVIAVGSAARTDRPVGDTRSATRRCSPRPAAWSVGNDVQCSGGKVGAVTDVSLDSGQGAG